MCLLFVQSNINSKDILGGPTEIWSGWSTESCNANLSRASGQGPKRPNLYSQQCFCLCIGKPKITF